MNIINLQMFLFHMGLYYKDSIDKNNINQTIKALNNFQKDNNLHITTFLNDETKTVIKNKVYSMKKAFNILGINSDDTCIIDQESVNSINLFQKKYNLTINGIMREKDFFALNNALKEKQNLYISIEKQENDIAILSSIKNFLIKNLQENNINVSKNKNDNISIKVILSSGKCMTFLDNKDGFYCDILKNNLIKYTEKLDDKSDTIKINIPFLKNLNTSKKRDDLAKDISNALISILHYN